MLKSNFTKKFEKDVIRMTKRGEDKALLKNIMLNLINEIPLERKYKDHALSGNYEGYRECPIKPDWLLIYYIENNVITFARTGTHKETLLKVKGISEVIETSLINVNIDDKIFPCIYAKYKYKDSDKLIENTFKLSV